MPVDHYENFPVASLLLPAKLRYPIEIIYRFARSADDIADEGECSNSERLAQLAVYQDKLAQIAAGTPPLADPIFTPLAEVIHQHQLPIQLFADLLDAFAQDVVVKRYADYPTLLDYCRRSANPVGRLVLHLFGVTQKQHMEQSDCICSALQLINFWQDVAIDWQKGRVYLPQEDLQRFGVAENHIAQATQETAWQNLMRFEVQRSRELMLAGLPLLAVLPGRLAWEIRLTIEGGLRILERLEQANYDVFQRRPKLAWRDWLVLGQRCLFPPSYHRKNTTK